MRADGCLSAVDTCASGPFADEPILDGMCEDNFKDTDTLFQCMSGGRSNTEAACASVHQRMNCCVVVDTVAVCKQEDTPSNIIFFEISRAHIHGNLARGVFAVLPETLKIKYQYMFAQTHEVLFRTATCVKEITNMF